MQTVVLFFNLKESSSHADKCHADTVMASTCAIQESENTSGGMDLMLVVEECGEAEAEDGM
jgi:hypothetical protein